MLEALSTSAEGVDLLFLSCNRVVYLRSRSPMPDAKVQMKPTLRRLHKAVKGTGNAIAVRHEALGAF